MKKLLSGVALAALIAVGAPVWAQAATTSSSPAAPGTAPIIPPANGVAPQPVAGPGLMGSSTATADRHDRAMHHHAHHAWYHHHHGWHHHGWRGGYGGGRSDPVAEQLNAEELNRLGAPLGMAPPPPPPR